MASRIDEFQAFPQRAADERTRRLEYAQTATAYGHAFLDDVLRGILRHDLVLIGAPSGVGKTDLALSIAVQNAKEGKNVAYFALEAEIDELERRTKFGILHGLARGLGGGDSVDGADALNYPDWLLGRCEHIVERFEGQAQAYFEHQLGTLQTYYRGTHFGPDDLARHLGDIGPVSDLVVIDHLHYVDVADENEARAQGELVKLIRDLALHVGVPIVLVAHLRKRDTRAKQLVASLDDFMGSSNIAKIATQAITLERAVGIEPLKWYLAPTFISIAKDRRAGTPGVVALCDFNRANRRYSSTYTLGRLTNGGTEWEPLTNDVPRWARNHRNREIQ